MARDPNPVLAALHAGDDELSPLVRGLTPEQLKEPSADTEWDVSQVLSHLGSSAVITLANLDATVAGGPNQGHDANQAVWARWAAMTPVERQVGFLAASADLLARYDSLDASTWQDLRIDLGFLPAPVDLTTAATFRLNEFALHSWDVRVAFDAAAVVNPAATPLLLDHVGLLLGRLARPAALNGRPVSVRVELSDLDEVLGLTLGEPSALGDAPEEPGAVLTLPAESWLRLVSGRLRPEHTPAGVAVTGDLTLDTLRQVFPGY